MIQNQCSVQQALDLYEVDYQAWIEATLQCLQEGRLGDLDVVHLLEEVEDLGRRNKRKAQSLLIRLWEHLLKLRYWEAALGENRGHWLAEVRSFRQQLQGELEDSPSLRRYLVEIQEDCYGKARLLVADRSQLPLALFPELGGVEIDRVLDESWFLE